MHSNFNNLIWFWTLLNILIPIAIVAAIFLTIKKYNDDKKLLFSKLDTLISLLQSKKDEAD